MRPFAFRAQPRNLHNSDPARNRRLKYGSLHRGSTDSLRKATPHVVKRVVVSRPDVSQTAELPCHGTISIFATDLASSGTKKVQSTTTTKTRSMKRKRARGIWCSS